MGVARGKGRAGAGGRAGRAARRTEGARARGEHGHGGHGRVTERNGVSNRNSSLRSWPGLLWAPLRPWTGSHRPCGSSRFPDPLPPPTRPDTLPGQRSHDVQLCACAAAIPRPLPPPRATPRAAAGGLWEGGRARARVGGLHGRGLRWSLTPSAPRALGFRHSRSADDAGLWPIERQMGKCWRKAHRGAVGGQGPRGAVGA